MSVNADGGACRRSHGRRRRCVLCYLLFCFFFSSRRRHTRLQGDWSSDVCSSDLSAIATFLHCPALRFLCWNDILSLASCQLPLARKPTAYLPCHARQRIRVPLRGPVVSGRGRLGRRQVPAAKFVGECLLRHIEEGTLVGRNFHQIRVGERRVVDFERLLLGSHGFHASFHGVVVQ